MPISAVAKISTDVGNSVSAGSDGGLYFLSSTQRGANSQYIIDNSWGTQTGTTYWYALPSGLTPSTNTLAANTAYIFPLAVARNATIAASPLQVSVATTASAIYLSLYGSNASTGAPAAKLADLFSYSASAAAVVTPTVVTASPTLTAHTLYYAAVWAYGGTCDVRVRFGMPMQSVRWSTAATAHLGSGGPMSAYYDTTSTWGSLTAGPATLTPIANTAVSSISYAPPHIWWGLTNV
jgi:hypothetical protein